MLESARRSLRESRAAFADVFANRSIRRLQLAWAGSMLGGTAAGIAFLVFAFDHNGAYAVGVIGLVRWLAAGAIAPIGGVIADRYRRVRVMVLTDVVRAVLMAGMAVVVIADGAPLAVYVLSIVVTLTSTAFRPAQAALTPSLARTPEELTAANVTANTVESIGFFIGPAIGGLLLVATNVWVVFLFMAALFLVSAVLVGGIEEQAAVRERREEDIEEEVEQAFFAETLGGFRVLAGDGRARLLVGLFTAQQLADGLLTVLVVVLALQTLDLGEAGLGFLNAAGGVGGLVGTVIVAALVGRARLAADFGIGLVAWGVPLVALALWPSPALALVALGLVGAGNTLVDVSGDTLLQRAVPDDLLGRVWGIMESLLLLSVAAGSVLAPVLIDAFGARVAVFVTGAMLPVLAILTWRRLTAIDAAAVVPVRQLELLRGLPMFAPLPPPTLEYLAGRLRARRFPAGQAIFHEGDPGDEFYVISEGTVQVSIDGRPARKLSEGDYFGEIALLRQVPRTATVAAETDVDLYALDGDQFVAAVVGHAESAAAADTVVATRLGASVARPATL